MSLYGNVNQITDLNRHGRVRTAARGFGSLSSSMVYRAAKSAVVKQLEGQKKGPVHW